MEVGEVLTSVRDDYGEEFYRYYLHDFVRNVHKCQNKKQEQAETEYNVSIAIEIILAKSHYLLELIGNIGMYLKLYR